MENTEGVIGARRLATLRDLANLPAASNTEDVCRRAIETLEKNQADLPFAVLYLVDGDSARRVAVTAGADRIGSAYPLELNLGESGFRRLLEELRPFTLDASPIGSLDTAPGSEPASLARAIPLVTPSHRGLSGFLAVGLTPHLAKDDGYTRFLDLVAQQISHGISIAFMQQAIERERQEFAEREQMLRGRADQALASSEGAHRLLVSLNDATRALGKAEEVMWAVVSRVGPHFNAGGCTYGEVDASGEHVDVSRDYTNGIRSVAGRHRLESYGPELIRDLRAGRTIVVPDIEKDPRTSLAPALAAFAAVGTRAVLAIPLVKEHRLRAMIVLHHPTAREWSPSEVALMEQIAERMWFAVEHARAEAALRESRDVLALAMRGGSMGAWSRNVRTNDVWWSPELEEIVGLTPGAFAGTERDFYDIVHQEDRRAVASAVQSALTSGTDYIVEFRFRHGSGEWRWMEGRGRAVYEPDGTPRFLYGIAIDITERKSTEQALETAKDEAESANRLKDQFLATLSHELRTPLNAILGYARMLQTDAIPSDRRRRAVDIIHRNAVIQNRLVEDLLDISRITSGMVQWEPDRIPVAGPLGEAIEAVRPSADAKHIVLSVDVDAFAGTVAGDATRLQQVFVNLLANAVKFTPESGEIGVMLRSNGDDVEVTVRDNGVGVPPEFLPYVFDPFRQADGRYERQHGGLGLGLAICKRLVELHGGSIGVSSEGSGQGSQFTVRLPRQKAADFGVPGIQADRRRSDRRRSRVDRHQPVMLDGVDILLVEDEPDTLALFRDALEAAGAAVRAVGSAAEALVEIDARVPSLLVMDLGLPGMDGYALLKEIRSREVSAISRVPAIAVTAYARLDDRAKALSAGFQEHVAKPIEPDELVRVLAQITAG